jgi:hypothetical protein
VLGLAKFSTRKTGYVEDANKTIKNYTGIESGYDAELHENLAYEDIENLAKFLENELNPNEKSLIVTADKEAKTIAITAANGGNPLKYMNAYYSETALTSNAFCFKNNTLTLGNASLRVARNIKRNQVETFLMIGETMGGGMNKLSVETSNEVKNINQLAQSDYP